VFKFISKFFDENAKRLKSCQPLVDQINSLEPKTKKLTDKQLLAKTDEFKKRLSKGETLDDLLPETYAIVREAIGRTIKQRAFDVQLMAAIALHQGSIAEQRTGEGKTHSVIFPAYLNALTGRGVHIITPNDYLTRVGTGWYPQALNLLGVSTSAIVHEESFILDPAYTDPNETVDDRLAHLRSISRQEAYRADVTYGTNNEFGFDYLRDHMVKNFDQKVQRPEFNFAIVDEVDFVLIDEARTPLIISSPNNQPVDKYYQFAKIAAQLQSTDYVVDEKSKSATLSEFGIRRVEKILNIGNLYEESFATIHYIENAIKSQTLFHKDKDYVIKDGEIIIVDEFTGRLMHGRRWSDGLHQAVEAKENVKVQQESQTWATITFQNYFRLYPKLSGMTGTAATEAEEFRKIYHLEVITIPTNQQLVRIDSEDLIFKNQRAKYAAIAAEVTKLYAKGQPVLIGTTSIAKNEIIASMLKNKGIPFQLLNAKNHRSEAEIIAKAGKLKAVTVATNMAGRGVDIILGGPSDKQSPKDWQKEHDEVVRLGGLFVIGTERHESRRIDNQLRGRSGRQGDPGFSQFHVALDDDLMRIFGGDKIQGLMTRFNMPENEALTHPLVSRVLEQIQVKVEGYNFDIRKNLVEYDDVINKQRQIIYSLRDNTLYQAKFDPAKNNQKIEEVLGSEISRLVLNLSDSEALALEFSEIMPLNPLDRRRLEKDLSTAPDKSIHLTKILIDQWQERQKYFGDTISHDIVTYAIIEALDPLWVGHLTALDDLRDGVRLRGYAQKDPLIEYRKEGYEMFQALMRRFEANLCRMLFRLEPIDKPAFTPQQVTEARGDVIDPNAPVEDVTTDAIADMSTKQSLSRGTYVAPSSAPTLGRNDPCWCGSGKKWKRCHYPALS